MLRTILDSLAGWFANWLAWGISFVHVNRVESDPVKESALVKTRALWHWLPVTVGNFVFRFRNPAVRILPTEEWKSWESAVAQAFGHSAECLQSGIRVTKFPGEPLADLLKQPHHSEQRKLIWVGLAAQELGRLHQLQIDVPSIGVVEISHADASVANVMIDRKENLDGISEIQSATWFDFDVRHDFRSPSLQRKVDDLRALLSTAAACCHWDDTAGLSKELKLAYPQTEVWLALKTELLRGNFDCDLFHLAQLRRVNPENASWPRIKSFLEQVL